MESLFQKSFHPPDRVLQEGHEADRIKVSRQIWKIRQSFRSVNVSDALWTFRIRFTTAAALAPLIALHELAYIRPISPQQRIPTFHPEPESISGKIQER